MLRNGPRAMNSSKYSQLFYDTNIRILNDIIQNVENGMYVEALKKSHSVRGAALIMDAPRLITILRLLDRSLLAANSASANLHLREAIACLSSYNLSAPFKQ